jgi:hypothetical protein
MFYIYVFTEQGGSETTVFLFMPGASFRIPVRKVVGVMLFSATPGTFLG